MGLDTLTVDPTSGGQGTSSFAYSFLFLPRDQRIAMRTIYAFCRETDDIVDNPADISIRLERLQSWQHELSLAFEGSSRTPLLLQVAEVARRFGIPRVHFHELIEGVGMDLKRNRYQSFDELRVYCYHVASSVGLMCLGIFGSSDERTKEYAINLGIALQLTNILRDVGNDACVGRIYLPQDDLAAHGCSEGDILSRRASPAFLKLMEFEVARAEEYFLKADALLPAEEQGLMFPARIMQGVYFENLQRIKREGHNVLAKCIVVPRGERLLIALKLWMRHRLLRQ